jgi:hypothetical protein
LNSTPDLRYDNSIGIVDSRLDPGVAIRVFFRQSIAGRGKTLSKKASVSDPVNGRVIKRHRATGPVPAQRELANRAIPHILGIIDTSFVNFYTRSLKKHVHINQITKEVTARRAQARGQPKGKGEKSK